MKTPDRLQKIEQQAQQYRHARDQLQDELRALSADITAVKTTRMFTLRALLTATADAESELRISIAERPELFDRPRTRTFHGVKVGLSKQRGCIEMDDEAKVIDRIRKLLPKNQSILLIRVRESVHKPSVYDLTDGDLKRLGIRVSADCDKPVVRDMAGEIDKAITALLDDLREVGDA